jgi:leucyl aminopeptidase
MAGAATVLAIFKALSELKPSNIEIHGFAPLTENMPGGNALKPGDVLKTMRGKTIEVLNTDAEGRLVLSDTLTYACRQQLDEIVDIATLTGACVVALGTQIVGLMGTSDLLKEKIKSASQKAGEKVWELPLEKEYLSLIKSPVADIKNIGPVGEAGTIIGGLFLKEFVDPGQAWVHLDIASSGWAKSPTPLTEVGATGMMVRTLLHYVTNN